METKGMAVTSNLPHDLLLEMLARSSVSDILKWRAVSKSLYYSTYQPSFFRAHLKYSKRNPTLLVISEDQGKNQVMHVWEKNQQRFVQKFSKSTNRRFHPGGVVLPSCNGLVCFVSKANTDIYLSNPGTQECVLLPRRPSLKKGSYRYVYGFGFDLSTNIYKVVSVYHAIGDSRSPMEVMGCEVLSIGDTTWRNVEHFSHILSSQSRSAFVNGAIYWMSIQHGNNPSMSVIAFDLATEEFKIIQHPKSFCVNADGWPFLGEFNGRLFLVDFAAGSPNIMEFWIKGNNHANVWKRCSITFPFPQPLKAVPIGFLHGIMVFQMSWLPQKDNLVLFDIRNGTQLPLKIVTTDCFNVSIYTESLVTIRKRPRLRWRRTNRRRKRED